MINKEIKSTVQKYAQEMTAFRRDLHRNPETSNEEFRTTERISEELTKAGITHRLVQPTGVIADITGTKEDTGKRIALRADMDALTLDELNDTPYKSCVPGKMHACGHDAHTAMLLYAAKALNDCKALLNGSVRFLFQPAEEVATGAKLMIANGCMDGVDNVFGMHVDPKKPAGCVAIAPGPSYASADILKIEFTGKGGHGAMPQDTNDAVVMASAFVMNLQTIVSRKVHPLKPAVVTIGKLTAGTRFNIIAETAVLEGTVRCFDIETRDMIVHLIQAYAEDTAKLYGGSVQVNYIYGTVPLINEEKSAFLAQRVITEAFGEKALVPATMTTGGEDFSFYQEYANGAFAALGTGNAEKFPETVIHHGKFDIDEAAMETGAELLCQYAFAYLNQNEF